MKDTKITMGKSIFLGTLLYGIEYITGMLNLTGMGYLSVCGKTKRQAAE